MWRLAVVNGPNIFQMLLVIQTTSSDGAYRLVAFHCIKYTLSEIMFYIVENKISILHQTLPRQLNLMSLHSTSRKKSTGVRGRSWERQSPVDQPIKATWIIMMMMDRSCRFRFGAARYLVITIFVPDMFVYFRSWLCDLIREIFCFSLLLPYWSSVNCLFTTLPRKYGDCLSIFRSYRFLFREFTGQTSRKRWQKST